jgi:hypothetical protein
MPPAQFARAYTGLENSRAASTHKNTYHMKKNLESQLAAFIGFGLLGLAGTLMASHEFCLAMAAAIHPHQGQSSADWPLWEKPNQLCE